MCQVGLSNNSDITYNHYATLVSNSELLRQWKRRVPKIPVAGRLDVIDGDVVARVALRQTDVSITSLCLDIKKQAYAKE